MDSDDMLLLKPDGIETYGTACEFVQVLTAKDGTQGGDRALPVRGRGRLRHAELRHPQEPEGPRRAHRLRQRRQVFGEVSPCP